LAGGLSVVGGMVQNGEYDQAAQTVDNLRLFNNGNSIASARSFQSRREFYNQAINSMDAMIAQLRKNSGADAGKENWDLQARTAQLEDTIAEMQKTIDGLNSGSSGQTRRLNELETSLSTLRSANAALEAAGAQKDRNISTLTTERDSLTQTVTARDNTIRDLRSDNESKDQEIARLQNRLNNVLQAAQE
jgi:chromosome segregation ATPase